MFQVQQALTKVTSLLASLLADMSPSTRKFVNQRSLTLDLLPLLLDILQPTLRPVSQELFMCVCACVCVCVCVCEA